MGSSWVKFRTQKYGLQARFQTQNIARISPYVNVVRTPLSPANGIFSPEAFEYFCLTSVFLSVFQVMHSGVSEISKIVLTFLCCQKRDRRQFKMLYSPVRGASLNCQ